MYYFKWYISFNKRRKHAIFAEYDDKSHSVTELLTLQSAKIN